MKSFKKYLFASLVFSCSLLFVHSQCPGVNPIYQDIETWVHSNLHNGISYNGIKVQITIINPSFPDGSHFFSAWGKSCFQQGVAGYGQCKLTTNPSVMILYSDRTYKNSTHDVNGNPINNINQPFSIKEYDYQVVSLDMVNNTITSKSITWKFEIRFTNVTRKGNVIYAVGEDGNMIILNLYKVAYKEHKIGPCDDW